MVEAPVGFVIVDNESCLGKDLRLGDQDVEDLGDVPCTVVDRPIRVFGITGRRHDPGNLRQCAARYILSELVEQVLGPGQPSRLRRPSTRKEIYDLSSCAAVLEKRAICRSIQILVEVEQGIIGKVAGEGIAGTVAEIRPEGLPGEVLIDLPGYAGLLEHFRESRKDP